MILVFAILGSGCGSTGGFDSTTQAVAPPTGGPQPTGPTGDDLPANPFLLGPMTPTRIYPVNMAGRSEEDQVLLSTLQGVLAANSSTHLFLYSENDNYYFPNQTDMAQGLTTSSLKIKNYLEEVHPELVFVPAPKTATWDIVDEVKDEIPLYSYITYDLGTDSQNIAVSGCGPNHAIPVTTDQVSEASRRNLILAFDARPMTYEQFLQSSDPNSNFAVELNPDVYPGPKDYAAMLGGMLFWTPDDADRRTALLDSLTAGNPGQPIPVFGWDDKDPVWPEFNFVNSVCKRGDFVVASDYSSNLSLYSSLKTLPKSVPEDDSDQLVYDDSKTYVTFIVSDGDNLQLLTNNINSVVYYGSPFRGAFPIGWSISPAMYYLQPDVWNFYIDNATPNDEFVLGPSTIGYVMGGVTQQADKFATQLDLLSTFLQDSGIKTALIFGDQVDRDDWGNPCPYLGPLMGVDQLEGGFYYGYGWGGGSQPQRGQFIGGKPVSSCLFTIDPTQQGTATLSEQASGAANTANSPEYQDIHKGFLAIYGVRNLNNGQLTSRYNDLIGAFTEAYIQLDHDKVTVVKPSQFLNLLGQAKKIHPDYWESNCP